MDVRLQGNSQLRYAVNGGAAGPNTRRGDEALQFLTQEEKECIQFFENTIDSLEETLEDDSRRTLRTRTLENRPPAHQMDRLPAPSSASRVQAPSQFTSPSSKDQDIIDLVRPDPDVVLTRDHYGAVPDFQTLVPVPESHFEMKPRRDPADSLPPDYNPPYSMTDPHAYHPPGSIPTPVLIAQKIAENQGGGASGVDPSSLLRRLSLESDKPQSVGADLQVKQGPPTSAKPTRLPANISMVLNSRDHQAQLPASINIQERRAQMLANLSGTSHPLLQENLQPAGTQKNRNSPGRSISFRDPTPDKSRMEALSKLGLNRSRAMSGGPTLFDDPDGNAMKLPTGDAGAKYLDPSSALMQEAAKLDRKPEILRSDSRRSYEEGSPQPSPSPTSTSQASYYPSSLDKPAVSPPPEVTSIEINSYGGKSIVVNPSVTPRNEPPVSPPPPEYRNLSSPTELNFYGGRSRAPPPGTVNLPDILSSHIDKSHPAPPRPESPSVEFNSYGGKSLNINPPAGFGNRHSDTPATSFKAPPPTPAPRPPRHTYHAEVTQQLVASRALSPDRKRKANLFRPQSITVEFCGRGPMDESRRAALRKLGLLKDS
ncbi:unnamed protein product [Ophioblennius macclurei]